LTGPYEGQPEDMSLNVYQVSLTQRNGTISLLLQNTSTTLPN
jgi:hypothetical protein